jgi:hypothetical protein
MSNKTLSDGSSTDYYKIPEGATDLIDLIEHKNMSFGVGNIFKACYRLGEKDGINAAYDLRKIIFFAKRALAAVERDQSINDPKVYEDEPKGIKLADLIALDEALILAGIKPPATYRELEDNYGYWRTTLAMNKMIQGYQ